MKKIIIAVVIALAVVGGGVGIYKYYTTKAQQVAKAPKYMTAKASIRNVQKSVSGSGSVETTASDSVKSDTRDTIASIKVKENQSVKKGDVLLTYENGSGDVVAPYDCIISGISVKEGDAVTKGQELMKIYDNVNLVTKINVDELDVVGLSLGQKANIKVTAYPDTKFTGTVTSIKQQGDYSNGVCTFEVTIAFDEIHDIKVGMTTEATIVVDSRSNVLTVPVEAVRNMGGQKMVLVPSDTGTPQAKKVEIGLADANNVEIKSGLVEGEQVQLPQLIDQSTSSQGTNGLRMPGMGGTRTGGGQGGYQGGGGTGSGSQGGTRTRTGN